MMQTRRELEFAETNKKVPAKGTEKYTHLEYSTKTCCTQERDGGEKNGKYEYSLVQL